MGGGRYQPCAFSKRKGNNIMWQFSDSFNAGNNTPNLAQGMANMNNLWGNEFQAQLDRRGVLEQMYAISPEEQLKKYFYLQGEAAMPQQQNFAQAGPVNFAPNQGPQQQPSYQPPPQQPYYQQPPPQPQQFTDMAYRGGQQGQQLNIQQVGQQVPLTDASMQGSLQNRQGFAKGFDPAMVSQSLLSGYGGGGVW